MFSLQCAILRSTHVDLAGEREETVVVAEHGVRTSWLLCRETKDSSRHARCGRNRPCSYEVITGWAEDQPEPKALVNDIRLERSPRLAH